MRNCSFNKMKMSELFKDFNWDDLIDFKMKAPYVPPTEDMSDNLKNINAFYENMIEVLCFNLE